MPSFSARISRVLPIELAFGVEFRERVKAVPNWKQVIVGDAFRAPSRDVDYYRDRLLIWPFLLSTIVALATVFGGSHEYGLAFRFGTVSLLCILLARERILLIVGALGFCAAQSLFSFVVKHDWIGLAVAIPTGLLFLVLIRLLSRKHYRPSYGWQNGLTLVDLLVGLTSLGFGIVVLRWMNH